MVEVDGLLDKPVAVEVEDAAAAHVDGSAGGGHTGPRAIVGTRHPGVDEHDVVAVMD